METEKYVDKVVELEDRCDLYLELQLWKKALEIAAKLKDANRLVEVSLFVFVIVDFFYGKLIICH